ncbi:hypothetical protein HMPREF9151_02444, partial [Hoylesella saccharolytica F0055]
PLPLERGDGEGIADIKPCVLFIFSLRQMRIFYLLSSLKLTNFLVVEIPMLSPNACDRSQQVVSCSQIRKSRVVIGCADFQ